MNPAYAPLFRPYTFNNGATVKNRLAVAPLTHFASDADGHISPQERAFLQNRFNGFGLFIAAATLVQADGKTFGGQPHAIGADDLPALREVAAIAQAQGAKAILQIHHGGLKAELSDDIVAPSADAATGARELAAAEIERLIAAYAHAARLAAQAGFDGVEIHGANGYLLQQFVSAQTNRRTDEWGGSLKNRLRFPLAVTDAVISAAKAHAKPDFIVGYRFSPEEPGEHGITMADTFALIDELVQKPLQYLHVSLWDFYKKVRRGADTARTRMELLHERIGGRLPLIGIGNLYTGRDIAQAFDTGWAEFIALGKTVLLNPNLPELLQQGREADIQTELDPARPDHYRLPDALWQRCLLNQPWLPPVKGMERRIVDV
ncbi:NADH-dependent flavin oxidoreductase [Eikenella sp. S3360]|uniref:NADH-dependent flavin oxidoreductase n=1 Tax=Eikenella glucosivorans TaxID=2766967 RepID=A0ABS0NC87_9NEIS|nr:NADH-dependent flavin oxidoreductase [Eikenella glucosivorans]MBH5329917.1 NADH-dependent flavin oxidoreductase [Eikenella glucosivorans]